MNATVGYGSPGAALVVDLPGVRQANREAARPDAPPLSSTLPAPPPPSPPAPPPPTFAQRSTVLPVIALDAGGTVPVLVRQDRPRYHELFRLGTGGVGEVTLAEDVDIGRRVAIKRLLAEGGNADIMRFVEEVRVMGQLDHPNIVPVHDVGCDADGRFFFVMKKLDGETLESIIERLRDGDPATHERYPIPVRVEIFLKILHAIQFAHAQGIIHRDIKPSNVMVGRFGEVVVLDWGIAKRLDDGLGGALDAVAPPRDETSERSGLRPLETRMGSLLGTPAYMSPEQARGENHSLDVRSDIYSLAVVFYELLSLRHYLEDIAELPALLDAVCTRVPPPAVFVRSNQASCVPAELSTLIQRGMAKERDERFGSVLEMIEALQRCRSGSFAISCPITFVKRAVTAVEHVIDAHPRTTVAALMGTVTCTLAAIAWASFQLLG